MKYQNIYFIGIGGIGMSAIARFCKFKGCRVSGYDRTPSDLTRQLEAEGIPVHYNDDSAMLPEDRENTLVVYTPAVPGDFGELAYAREKGTTSLMWDKSACGRVGNCSLARYHCSCLSRGE